MEEEARLNKLAFEVIDLPEHEKAAANLTYWESQKHDYLKVDKTALLRSIERNGKIPEIMEAALQLKYSEYLEVKEIWEKAPEPEKPKRVRRRK